MASTDAMPVPKKNVAYRHYFALRNTDGTLCTSWAGQDTELSKDGGAFADATNEATEIGSSGCGYVDLTSAETNYDAVVIKVTVTNTDALPYIVTLFPEEAGDIRVDATQISGSSTAADNVEIVFDTDFATNYSTDNDKWQTEADVTKWKGTAPADLTDTDKVQVSVQHMANSIIAAANIASDAIAAAKIANGAITAAKLGADCITSDKIADDAIAAEHLASGAIVAATFAAGAIDASAIAGDAITSDKIADDAIGDEHWNVTSVSANLSDAAKLSIQKIAAGGIR